MDARKVAESEAPQHSVKTELDVREIEYCGRHNRKMSTYFIFDVAFPTHTN